MIFFLLSLSLTPPPLSLSLTHTHTHWKLLIIYQYATHTKSEEWNNVRNTVARAEHTVITSGPDDIQIDGGVTSSLQSLTILYQPKLHVALGLAHLAEGKYADAAKIFASLSLELTNQFASVISAEDIALYGSILGLATMDRELLHACVIDGIFKGRLEVCYMP